MRILKYLSTGGIGLVVNLGTLHILAGIVGYHYLISSIIAVSLSTIVGFLLQKYWTFAERSSSRAGWQFVLYVLIALANIAVNTFIVYVLVDVLGTHYLFAQFVGAGTVAVSSYFLYRGILFRPTPPAAS